MKKSLVTSTNPRNEDFVCPVCGTFVCFQIGTDGSHWNICGNCGTHSKLIDGEMVPQYQEPTDRDTDSEPVSDAVSELTAAHSN